MLRRSASMQRIPRIRLLKHSSGKIGKQCDQERFYFARRFLNSARFLLGMRCKTHRFIPSLFLRGGNGLLTSFRGASIPFHATLVQGCADASCTFIEMAVVGSSGPESDKL